MASQRDVDLVIRQIGPSDRAFFEGIRNLLTQLYPQNQNLSEEVFDTVINGNAVDVFVALLDGKPVATASLARYQKLGGKVHVIEDVVVSVSYRGKGIGRKLTEAMLKRAEELGGDFVDVSTRRPDAHDFYIKCGFSPKDETRPLFSLRYVLKC